MLRKLFKPGKMKNTEIKELTVKEIEERIENEEVYLVKLKLNHTVSPLDDPLKIRKTKRNIARLKTALANRANNENIEVADKKEEKE